jgi:hypothetical protein
VKAVRALVGRVSWPRSAERRSGREQRLRGSDLFAAPSGLEGSDRRRPRDQPQPPRAR